MLQRWGILAAFWICTLGVPAVATAQEEALCAEVRIEILQELTLERQGFEAIMRITNSLDTYSIEDIAISVNFADADGNSVTATSDTSASDAAFFIRIDDTQSVNSLVTGDNGEVTDAVINAGNVGEFRWLIVPTANAAGETDNGELYFVGATLSYSYGGKEEVVEVAPDSIVVKPQPLLTLDYFLTEEVVGDDAFTTEIEPPEPYTLGVRIDNSGYGAANKVKIESAQPRIVDNEQGLAIDFTITKSFVENQAAQPSLLIDFGEIDPNGMKAGRWIMESTLSGKFTSFNASFTHADELGGELTSLIEATNAHLLVRDVKVDLAGRDAVPDFLAYGTDGNYYVYESQNTGADLALCKSCAEVLALSYSLGSESGGTRVLFGAAEAGFGFVKVADPYGGAKVLHKVVRDDGKQLDAANYWTSKERAENKVDFNHYLNVFDFGSTGSYTLYFVDASAVPQAPVIQAILDRSTHEGSQVGFLVQSSDPNGTVPQLSATSLPAGATFNDGGDGTGIFRWQPAIGQAGNYVVSFTATDGELSSQRAVNIAVNPADDTDGDGLSDAWEMEHFGNLDRDGTGDYDEDGRTDAQEEEVGSDPTVPEVAPGAPQIASPVYDGEVLNGASSLLPTLTITNGEHAPEMIVAYQFEVYADEAMLDKVAESTQAEGSATTSWTVANTDLLSGKAFADNTLYYWRARAITQVVEGSGDVPVASEWQASRFFVNTANDAPGAAAIVAPAVNAIVADLRPTLVVAHAVDLDRDTLSYGFDLFHESDLENPIAQVSGLLPGGNFQTKWQVPNPLQEDNAYVWNAWVQDAHGARTDSAIGTFLVSTQNNKPVAPTVVAPSGALQGWLPNNGVALRVRNGIDPEQQPLTYHFEVDTLSSFDSAGKLSSGPVAETAQETAWTVEGLQEDTTYYWRAKVSDGAVDSDWVTASFSVNAGNAAPPTPSLQNPGDSAVVETLRPLFEVNPVIDPDGDTVQYRFEVYSDAALTLLVASQLQAGTQWTPGFDFDDNTHYYWRASAEDGNGGVSDWTDVNTFAVNENGINDAPTISLVLPDSEITLAEPEILIQWQDADPDSSASVSIYYLYEGSGRTLIAEDIAEDADGAGDQYLWDASGLLPGNYSLQLEITDGESTVVADGCCNIVVPSQTKRITATPTTDLLTDEAGTVIAAVDVVLDQPLQAGTSLTLNVSVSDTSEARLLGENYLQFTADNWNTPQTVQLQGVDDCEVDGNRPFNLVFQPAQSDDSAYSGYLLDSIELVNADSEVAGQTLFICQYALEQDVPVAGGTDVDSHYLVTLNNTGVGLVDASATLTLLPSPDLNYSASVISGGTQAFANIAAGASAQGNEALVIRHPASQTVDFAKFAWSIQSGDSLTNVEGDSGHNTLQGTEGADTIDGKSGNDTIFGGDGDDVIIGGAGTDKLYGEAGNDTFVIEGNDGHADRIEGGDGFDQIVGGGGDDAIRLSVFSGAATVERIDGSTGFNAIYGTSAHNTLDFSNTELVNIDFIDGLAGNDTIYGSSSNDKIIGNTGSDKLYGNAGDDIFIIEGNDSGYDRVEGGTGFDQVIGSDGDDWFRFSVFSGNARVEAIDGGAGVNQILANSANNTLDFRDISLINISRIDGAAGNDTIYGSSTADTIIGGMGSDKLYGEGGDDRFLLTPGDTGFERYDGGAGDDWILGTTADDTIRLSVFSGNARVEVIDGGGGMNRILANSANNTLDFSETQLVSIDSIDAGKGNDTVKGSESADIIIGGEGSDLIYGNGGADTFHVTEGDTGFDHYQGGEGIDRLLGTDGDDEIRLSVFSGNGRVEIIDGGSGTNRIVASTANNTFDFSETQLLNIAEIDMGAGNDTVYGTDGADRIIGGIGSDKLYGNDGDDVFVATAGDSGYDRYEGGDGFDTLLATADDDVLRLSAFSGNARVERIDGGAGSNTLRANSANNTLDFRGTELVSIALIDAAAGNDTIYGTDLADVIEGGVGSDNVYGEAGDDLFLLTEGDTGFDSYRGGTGIDSLRGTPGDDIFRFSAFAGEASVEIVDGNGGTDIILATSANNTLDFSSTQLIGISSIDAGAGNDTVYGSSAADTIIGGLGSDYLDGGSGDDTFLFTEGDTGSDRYSGGEGFDQLLGTDGDDDMLFSAFSGAATVERIDGKLGVNRILSNSANNTLDFSSAEILNISEIDAGAGNDTVKGTSGNDVIVGGTGSDQLYGNAGDDIFIHTAGDTSYDRYEGGEGNDTLQGTDGDDDFRLSAFSGNATVEVIDGKDGSNRIVGSSANNTFDFRNTSLVNISLIATQSGNDTVYGTGVSDTIEGGLGSDNLYGEGGDDIFLITAGDTGYDRYAGGDGIDEVLGTTGSDLIRLAAYAGASTVERINGNGGQDIIQGTTGNNTLDFSTTELLGIAEIDAAKGNDTVLGSPGDDTIRGGEGTDTLYGNAGADIYIFARGDGADSIRDSGSSEGDTLYLEGAITPEDVWIVRNGSHLDIYLLAGPETIKIVNWQSLDNRIEAISTESGALLPFDKIDALANTLMSIGIPVAGVINLDAEQQAQVAEAIQLAWQ
ncbi:putative Ig domain-containing protein [Microbulbifer sp. YPW1]|uniref:putative Ig domain-containing protein n=1 Tax=Microbulbifer sp. YPW1 TaxID=2745199 RepID=UPI00159A7D90|nr:putative Ig domain-containing protein [Microbulbifer sp. YPW1]QKX18566.1 calcium-binding protein [Microbulbifer sp. YPW1]